MCSENPHYSCTATKEDILKNIQTLDPTDFHFMGKGKKMVAPGTYMVNILYLQANEW